MVRDLISDEEEAIAPNIEWLDESTGPDQDELWDEVAKIHCHCGLNFSSAFASLKEKYNISRK